MLDSLLPAKKKLFLIKRYPNGDTGFIWINPVDTTLARQLLVSKRRNLIGSLHLINGKMHGIQYYFYYDTYKPAILVEFKRGRVDGKWYEFYPSGRIHLVADKLDSQYKGKYFEFYDRPGYAPKVYREFVLHEGEGFRNGEIVFDSITSKPRPDLSEWLPIIQADRDTVNNGDSIHFTARVRFPRLGYSSAKVVIGNRRFISQNSTVKFAIKAEGSGLHSLQGELAAFKIVPDSPEYIDKRPMYFTYYYYVR